MLARWFAGAALVCVLVSAAPARAAEEKVRPMIVVGARSLDDLLSSARYLAKLGGQEERARQAEKMIRSKYGKKGLAGIDPKRPWGFYAGFDSGNEDEISMPVGVIMVPVADQKAILNQLKEVDLEPEEKDGIYSVSPEFLPGSLKIYFRFVNKYAYVTALSADPLDKDKLLDPKAIQPGGKSAVAFANVRMDRLPETIKQLALQNLERQLKRAERVSPPRESEAQRALRKRILKDLAAGVEAVIKDGKDLAVRLRVDPKAHKVAGEIRFTGKPDSGLANKILALAKTTSLFADLGGADSAASGLLRLTLPEDLRKAVSPLVDKAIKDYEEKEQDEGKRDLIVRLLKSLAPSVKSGEIDYAAALRGPSKAKKYTLVAGLRLKDATGVEKVLRDLVKVAPEADRAKVKLDADKEGDVAIHRLEIKDKLDKGARTVFGDAALYVAFRKDAVLLALGEDGLEVIKSAIKLKPKPTRFLREDVNLSRLVPFIAAVSRDEKGVKLMQEVFDEEEKDPGKIHISVEGGKALKAEVSLTEAAVKLLIRAGMEARRRRAADDD
jgi:hypothetical protein